MRSNNKLILIFYRGALVASIRALKVVKFKGV